MKTAEHSIVLTQRGAASAVVHDYRTHQRFQDALLMLKLMVQGEADVSGGRTIDQERVFADLGARVTDTTDARLVLSRLAVARPVSRHQYDLGNPSTRSAM